MISPTNAAAKAIARLPVIARQLSYISARRYHMDRACVRLPDRRRTIGSRRAHAYAVPTGIYGAEGYRGIESRCDCRGRRALVECEARCSSRQIETFKLRPLL